MEPFDTLGEGMYVARDIFGSWELVVYEHAPSDTTFVTGWCRHVPMSFRCDVPGVGHFLARFRGSTSGWTSVGEFFGVRSQDGRTGL